MDGCCRQSLGHTVEIFALKIVVPLAIAVRSSSEEAH